ncbi:ribose-phosphate pyrophosphokinase [Variovorax sp. HW608]|uniref:ribose-phosphate diphosphokinase n=1 Tax=Variovorax sp. HW608 TaxID=1034889 RepID=UPI00081F874E|nr:ribose-phosphate pyrophosphokinase [Variovorax sp. HW608]SCK28166.1 ribose-phosphate pyrophosphokinase [Variovorax sp. HW608]
MDNAQPCLFAPAATLHWAQAVAKHMDLALSPLEEREFEDGEHKSRPLCSVRGRDVYVLQSLHSDARASVNDKLCRLLFLLGALRDASAARITAVVPYLGYARKDRKSQPRDPVTTRYVATMFEAVGTDRIVTLDVHNLSAYQNAFRCQTDHLEATGLLVRHFAPRIGNAEAVVVAPDAGGIQRAERFRLRLEQTLGRPVGSAFAEKHRSGGVVSGELFVGDVSGRFAIIVDDLIGTGGTIARTAEVCARLGAASVHAGATHGLFVGNAASALDRPALASIVIADTVPPERLPEGPVRDKLVVLPTHALFAEAIRRLATGGSITQLLAS